MRMPIGSLLLLLASLAGCGDGDDGASTPHPAPSATTTPTATPAPATTPAARPRECNFPPLADLDGDVVNVESCTGACTEMSVGFTSCQLTRRGGRPTLLDGLVVERVDVTEILSCFALSPLPSGPFRCDGGGFEESSTLTERRGTFVCGGTGTPAYHCGLQAPLRGCRERTTALGVPGAVTACPVDGEAVELCGTGMLCVEDRCVPLASCIGGCEAATGRDPDGSLYRTRCTLVRSGQSPDPLDTGLSHRDVVATRLRCYLDERSDDATFRAAGRCEQVWTAERHDLFCEGAEVESTVCVVDPRPADCRTVRIAADGRAATTSDCIAETLTARAAPSR